MLALEYELGIMKSLWVVLLILLFYIGHYHSYRRLNVPARDRVFKLHSEADRGDVKSTNGQVQSKVRVPSPEEKLRLRTSIESQGFLTNIIEYGNNRMARRAVGILQKMPAYQVTPEEAHYTQAIWACEKSSQYQLALSVFQDMMENEINPTTSTYEALISLAEKTNHFDEAIAHFYEMQDRGLSGSTEAYNMCLIALDNIGRAEDALGLLKQMEEKGIKRDVVTYTACIKACSRVGEADLALQTLEGMKMEGVEVATETYNAVMWACVKGGYWQSALDIWQEMEFNKIQRDVDSFQAAIWACEMGGDAYKAVSFLKLMNFEGLRRTAMAFDGAISALNKVGDWEMILDILKWMGRDEVGKTPFTYKLAIECLENGNQEEKIGELYLMALRDGYFSPWVKNTRRMDIRRFSLSMAKIALKTVFLSMKDHKLALFTLQIIVGDEVLNQETGEKEYYSSFDVDSLFAYLSSLDLLSTGQMTAAEGLGLRIERTVEDGHDCFIVTREALLEWLEKGV